MSERICEHWEMAFCVVGPTVFVECMKCQKQASLKVDGAALFTTNRAKMALEGKDPTDTGIRIFAKSE